MTDVLLSVQDDGRQFWGNCTRLLSKLDDSGWGMLQILSQMTFLICHNLDSGRWHFFGCRKQQQLVRLPKRRRRKHRWGETTDAGGLESWWFNLSSYNDLLQGGSDPHWGHGERVPARQPGDAEPGGQHHPSHRLRPLWHSQRLNRAGHPVAPGDLFNVGCTLYAPLWLHFIFFFGLHSSTAGVLWATAWTAEASDKSDQVCGENRAWSLALFPEVVLILNPNTSLYLI